MKTPLALLLALGAALACEEQRAAEAGERPPPATAAALEVVEYEIPRASAFPHDPAVSADRMVWYTDQRNSFIGRLDPETGAFRDWPTPTRASATPG